jgi:transcription initiation factor IIF auxiliary subunit
VIVSTQLIETHSQGKDSGVEGFPLRSWSIEIYLLNENGEQVPANLFDKVVYRLHPSFGERANQSMSTK